MGELNTAHEQVRTLIRQNLDKNNMSMRELARLTDIDIGHVSRVLSGKTSITPDFLRRIAPHLTGTSYSQLMDIAGFQTPVYYADEDELNRTVSVLLTQLRIKTEQEYTKQRLKSDPLDNREPEFEHEDEEFISGEIGAQTIVLASLVDAAKDLKCREQFSFMTNKRLSEIYSKMTSLSDEQLTLIAGLVDQFAQ